MSDTLNILDLGKRDYKETWELQKFLHKKRLGNRIKDTLILVEHYPVITMGKSGKESNLLIPHRLLKEKGIEFFKIERGGDVTFHGPGQIVGYPIFNIRHGFVGIKPFIQKIEKAIILTLEAFGIAGLTRERLIGVWTEAGKICSIGIAVQRWISFHGFALNVNTDLKCFDYIVPCGLKGIKMTSMAEILRKEIPPAQVKAGLKLNFGSEFDRNPVEICLNEII